MLYIEQSDEQQTLRIERYADAVGDLTLTLTNIVTREAFSVTIDEYSSSRLYVMASATLPILPVGEYGYTLIDEEGGEVSEGLAVVGGYAPDIITDDDTITYKQYE